MHWERLAQRGLIEVLRLENKFTLSSVKIIDLSFPEYKNSNKARNEKCYYHQKGINNYICKIV